MRLRYRPLRLRNHSVVRAEGGLGETRDREREQGQSRRGRGTVRRRSVFVVHHWLCVVPQIRHTRSHCRDRLDEFGDEVLADAVELHLAVGFLVGASTGEVEDQAASGEAELVAVVEAVE